MTYLNLINQVLMRLRENQVDGITFDSTPYYSVIGSFVNDAKTIVEDSWDWGALRTTRTTVVPQGQSIVMVSDSQENSFRIQSVLNTLTGQYLTPIPLSSIQNIYKNNAQSPVTNGVASSYGFYENYWDTTDDSNANNGNQQIRLASPSDVQTTLIFQCTSGQGFLTAATQRMKVPAAPVYLLATALAVRERGETNALSTSELTAIANTALSDAIALDAARFPEELYWYNPSNMRESNWSTS